MFIEIVLVLILLYLLINDDGDGMTSDNKHIYAQQVLKNEHLFSNHGTLHAAKTQINWLDPVAYEDIRDAFRTNNFNEANIINILKV